MAAVLLAVDELSTDVGAVVGLAGGGHQMENVEPQCLLQPIIAGQLQVGAVPQAGILGQMLLQLGVKAGVHKGLQPRTGRFGHLRFGHIASRADGGIFFHADGLPFPAVGIHELASGFAVGAERTAFQDISALLVHYAHPRRRADRQLEVAGLTFQIAAQAVQRAQVRGADMLDAETREVNKVGDGGIDDVFKFQQTAVVQRGQPDLKPAAPAVGTAEEFQNFHLGAPAVRRLSDIALGQQTMLHIQHAQVVLGRVALLGGNRLALIVHFQLAPVGRVGQFALECLGTVKHTVDIVGGQCAAAKALLGAGTAAHIAAGQAEDAFVDDLLARVVAFLRYQPGVIGQQVADRLAKPVFPHKRFPFHDVA